jgi:hypothetical protein
MMATVVRSWTRLAVPAGLVSLLTFAAGCSSQGSISGNVTYQNKPLTGGTVLFTSTQGRGTRTAQIGPDGSYSIDKMPAGPVKIAVETSSAQPVQMGFKGPPTSMTPPAGANLPPGADTSTVYGSTAKKAPVEKIPENFGDPDKSGLTYTVIGGPQTHNIDLK